MLIAKLVNIQLGMQRAGKAVSGKRVKQSLSPLKAESETNRAAMAFHDVTAFFERSWDSLWPLSRGLLPIYVEPGDFSHTTLAHHSPQSQVFCKAVGESI